MANNDFDVEILLLDNPDIEFEIDKRIKIVFIGNAISDNKSNVSEYNAVEFYKVLTKPVSIKTKIKIKKAQLTNRQQHLALEQLEYLRQRYADKIFEYVKHKPEHIVISWMTLASISTCFALRKLPNELIFVECTSPYSEFPDDHAMNTLRQKYYARAKKCICQTPKSSEYYGFLKNTKRYVIPNPIIGNYPNRYEGERKKYIVNFCRLDKVKNIPLLIDALQLLQKDYPEYQLHIFGEGGEKNNLITYVNKLGLSDSVIFFDFDINLHNRIRDYAMFVSSSDREGMSNSMLEAMTIGLPTIVTDTSSGAARMLIQNYENGIIVPVRDKTALYQAMKYIIENPDKAKEMSINATHINEQLSMERIGKMWIDAIME